MSKRRARGAPTSARRPPVRARGFPGRKSVVWLVVGTAAAFVAWNRFARRPEVALPPPSPAERMSGDDAHETGLRLGFAGRHLASLPYFRRAMTDAPHLWSGHENYASTLVNGAQEGRIHLGKDESATRSSVERATMIGEAFQQLDAALSLTSNPRERAVILFQRAQVLQTFGLVADATVGFQSAAALDPANPGIAQVTRNAMTRLRTGGVE